MSQLIMMRTRMVTEIPRARPISMNEEYEALPAEAVSDEVGEEVEGAVLEFSGVVEVEEMEMSDDGIEVDD